MEAAESKSCPDSPCGKAGTQEKYGGLEVSEARRLRQLEDENSQLKRLLAEEKLDNHALKVALGKH